MSYDQQGGSQFPPELLCTTSRSEIGNINADHEPKKQDRNRILRKDRTFSRPSEFHEEFLHPIVHHLHLIVAHHPATTKNRPPKKIQIKTEPPRKESIACTQKRKQFPRSSQLHEVHLAALAWGGHLGGKKDEIFPSSSGDAFPGRGDKGGGREKKRERDSAACDGACVVLLPAPARDLFIFIAAAEREGGEQGGETSTAEGRKRDKAKYFCFFLQSNPPLYLL